MPTVSTVGVSLVSPTVDFNPPSDFTLQKMKEILQKTPFFQDLCRTVCGNFDLPDQPKSISIRGLHKSSISFLIATLKTEFPDLPFFVVFPTQKESENFARDLQTFESSIEVATFSEMHSFQIDEISPPKSIIADRLNFYYQLLHHKNGVFSTTIRSALSNLPSRKSIETAYQIFQIGEEIQLGEVISHLLDWGYQRVNMVEVKGDFARRGDILDIYPINSDLPIRIDLFGDEIDQIRTFDLNSQRSIGKLDEILIHPMHEAISDDDDFTNTIFDFLPQNSIHFLIEPTWIKHEATNFAEKSNEIKQVSHDLFIGQIPKNQIIQISSTPKTDPTTFEIDFKTQPLGLRKGNYQSNFDRIKAWIEAGFFVKIFCENERFSERFENILIERKLPSTQIGVSVGALSEGFFSVDLKLAVMSDHEIFGREYRPIQKPKFKEGAPIASFIDLKVGDYVVHVSHGIGVYLGIKPLEIGRNWQDFLAIEYGDGDMLYVPTYQIDMVQKYVGGKDENYKPKIDRLGRASWQNRKAKAQKAIEEMADELLELYAKREKSRGFAFPIDSPWQREFDLLFPFQETPDQLTAIDATRSDMEKEKPMDRLICGDVGYGKTEVAMRAAFKSATAGKQVAILVPTTVLALQHFNTFLDRFDPFPIKIEMLNRLRTAKQATEIKRELKEGKIDIVIGTHSILSESVKFADLGLLVIDEEHRFGVRHKETIKQLRTAIDVLTLTATPIPRTLHMALTGMRDFTQINTPPESRLPIETYVMEYDLNTVRNAILREMDRGGQIFFVHNRVKSIDGVAASIQAIVPKARIAIGHGQMPERQLEKVIIDFMKHKYDILVSTMIIESGIDIPNVNTILINRADALGLAQLYQLRGRVGRAQTQAYGYLFYPQGRTITEGAQKRLRAIEEFTELGSGFKIALRDLEIRGAGNLLGSQQHGHIVAIGYDLYCQMLEKTVAKMKGEEIEIPIETRIDLPIEANLPNDYVPDHRQKVSIYRRIADLKNESERNEMELELRDRFGKIPKSVDLLLDVIMLKRLCQSVGVEKIFASEGNVKIMFDLGKAKVDLDKMIELIQNDRRLSLTPPARLSIKMKGLHGRSLIATIGSVLKKIAKI